MKKQLYESFEKWWKENGGGECGKDACERAWHAGQAAVGVAKIYYQGKGKPVEYTGEVDNAECV